MSEGHSYHDLLWVYPIELVHKFYSLAVRKQQRNMHRLAGVLQLVGYSARSLDKKGDNSIRDAWQKIFKGYSDMERITSQSIQRKRRNVGAATPSEKNRQKLQQAEKVAKFHQPEARPKLRPVITETGNEAANVFLRAGMPTAF